MINQLAGTGCSAARRSIQARAVSMRQQCPFRLYYIESQEGLSRSPLDMALTFGRSGAFPPAYPCRYLTADVVAFDNRAGTGTGTKTIYAGAQLARQVDRVTQILFPCLVPRRLGPRVRCVSPGVGPRLRSAR